MTGVALRRAREDKADALTALCLRSKAVWGYDDVFMAAFRAELLHALQRIRELAVFGAEMGGVVVGLMAIAVRGTEVERRSAGRGSIRLYLGRTSPKRMQALEE